MVTSKRASSTPVSASRRINWKTFLLSKRRPSSVRLTVFFHWFMSAEVLSKVRVSTLVTGSSPS